MLGINRRQLLMLGILVSGTFIAILNQTCVAPALPTIMREMSVSAATVQWLTTGFTMVNAVMIPVSAYLTDRFSVRRLFLTVMAIFTAGTALVSAGPSFQLVLLGRLVQACGAGVLMPMVMTVLLLTFPVERRGMAMGIFNIVIAFAPTVGPVVAGIIIDQASWRFMFVAVAALSLVDLVFAAMFLRYDYAGDPTAEGLDKLSVTLSTLGFGGMLYGFSVIGNSGFNVEAVVAVALGTVVTVLFFRRQMRMERPMLRVDVLKNRKFLIATVLTMLVQGATMANAVLIPVFVQTINGQSATVSALVMLPGGIAMGVLGPVVGRVFDRRGPRALSIAGLVLVVVGTLLMSTLSYGMSMVMVSVYCLVRLSGLACINMPVTTWGMNALDNKVINHGNAVNNTLRQVAGSLGAALMVSAYSLFSSFNAQAMGREAAQVAGINFSFSLQAVLLIAGLVVAVVFVKDRPGDAAAADPTGERRAALEGVMTREVPTLPAAGKVIDAARLFAERDIDTALLVDADEQLVGVVSDGDIIRALTPSHEGAYVPDPIVVLGGERVDDDLGRWLGRVMEMPLASVATSHVISVDVHASMSEVYRVLGENHLHQAPVLEDGRLVGMVSRSAVASSAMRRYLEWE